MLNRRNFLRAGLTTGAVALPLAASLDPAFALTAVQTAPASEHPPTLIPLPPRLASENPATLSWQQKVRRVGQSNMTEHDPAVMNIEEWADYLHSAGADVVFIKAFFLIL